MSQAENPHRRSLDPENDRVILWVICTALLFIVLVSGLLYALSDHSTKYTAYQMKDEALTRLANR
jgi:hypothetical protein